MKRVRKIILAIIITMASIVLAGLLILAISATPYNGLWKLEGYGFCFDMKYGKMKAYEVTDSYYIRAKEYDGYIVNGVLYCGFGKFLLNLPNSGEGRLQLLDRGAQYIYTSVSMKKEDLERLHVIEEYDPVAMFEMFYESFNENYAFTELYGVDLQAEYAKLRPTITAQTSQEDLYLRMCDLVSKLKDGHVEIGFEEKVFNADDTRPEWAANKEQKELLGKVITGNYIKDYYKFEDSYIRYGSLREDIGYVLIHALGMEELNKSASTRKALDRIIAEFEDKDTIVIDLRFCSGGFDEASLLISSYFTRNSYLAYKKQVYYKGKYTELQDIYVNPGESYFSGKIVILTSGYTVSAAETLIRAMTANPDHNITLVGEETAGYYSDGIPKVLPGGFYFTMSSERYLWYDDSPLEGKGVIPQVEIPIDLSRAHLGQDQALDWVLENY